MNKGILYYSSNELDEKIDFLCRDYIRSSGLPITSVTLKPINFGHNLISTTPKSYQTLFENILWGLETMKEDIVFFCEADVIYHSNHFDFTPTDHNTIYYNGNYWVIRVSDGFAVHYDMGPLSGLCAFRDILVDHYRERVEYVKKNGFSYRIGFEPMSHNRIKWEHMYKMERFYPTYPNLDLYHRKNLTNRKWSPDKFVTRPKFWEESNIYGIQGWTLLPGIVERIR